MYVKMCMAENDFIFEASPTQTFSGEWETAPVDHYKHMFVGEVKDTITDVAKVPHDGHMYFYPENTPGAPDKRSGFVRVVAMHSNTAPQGEPYGVATEPAPMTHSEFEEFNKDELVEKFPTLDISWTRKQMASHLRSKGLLV